jgi:hypothetical protein
VSTIAVTSEYIAWDSQVTIGDNEKGRVGEQKVQVHKSGIWGLVGDGPPMKTMIAWVEAGADIKRIPDGNWDLFRIKRNGKLVQWSSSHPYESAVTYPQAYGSGGKYAISLLVAGHDAREAVKIASQLDIYTGPPIKHLVISQALQRVRS